MAGNFDDQGAFKLHQAVPWGRSRAEYEAFFDLGALPADKTVLDCAAGPSSYTAEMADAGRQIIAVDPLYVCRASVIARRVEEAADLVLDNLRKARARFRWDYYGTPENLVAARRATMRRFLGDFGQAAHAGRYVAAALPALPFPAAAFDLVVCSHFLFLYSHSMDGAFHARAIEEMLRVGQEVRIFPLIGLDGAPSPHLDLVRRQLAGQGYWSDVRRVSYEFQKGGNRMLCVGYG